MTIIRSLQNYIKEYKKMDLTPISNVHTDFVPKEYNSFAIAPMGNGKVKKNVLGETSYQNEYTFFAKEVVEEEGQRAQMYDFLEDFTEWLDENNNKGYLPTLKDPYVSNSLEVSNSMLFDVDENGLGVYQVQISLNFSKKQKEVE